MPFSLKSLRSALQGRGVGKVTLKRRGSEVEAESFVRRLQLRGENEATTLRTRYEGRHAALIIDPVPKPEKIVSAKG